MAGTARDVSVLVILEQPVEQLAVATALLVQLKTVMAQASAGQSHGLAMAYAMVMTRHGAQTFAAMIMMAATAQTLSAQTVKMVAR
jgi:hypothetical protein